MGLLELVISISSIYAYLLMPGLPARLPIGYREQKTQMVVRLISALVYLYSIQEDI